MTTTKTGYGAVALALVLVAPAGAAEAKPQGGGAPDMSAMMPKPGPAHEVLKADVGVWDATVESWPNPGGPPMTSKGTETVALVGGLWMVSDFKADLMGMSFEGHGVTGWDPGKKKYVGTWVDSMSSGISLSESDYDPAKKTMTGLFEGPDMNGSVQKMRAVTEWKDADTRVFSMYGLAGGQEQLGLRITYKRRKP